MPRGVLGGVISNKIRAVVVTLREGWVWLAGVLDFGMAERKFGEYRWRELAERKFGERIEGYSGNAFAGKSCGNAGDEGILRLGCEFGGRG